MRARADRARDEIFPVRSESQLRPDEFRRFREVARVVVRSVGHDVHVVCRRVTELY